jgi:hypothetical protein
MPIAYTDTLTGRILVEWPGFVSISPGPGPARPLKPEELAAILKLAPGTWRIVTAEEAAELQKPTPEERRAEIRARLEALSDELLPKGYTVINALCGDAEARAIVEAKREAHEAAAEPLRAELRALAGEGEGGE